jgi:hypothetical protein
MNRNRRVTCLAAAALAALLTVSEGWAQVGPPEEGAAPAKPRAKRVWTNDDFPSAVPQPVAAKPASPAPAAAATVASPEAERARAEVASEMLSAAQLRQRAYESNLTEIRNKLQAEASPFRRQVFEKFIRDVETLSAQNQKLTQQLSREKTGGAPGEGK